MNKNPISLSSGGDRERKKSRSQRPHHDEDGFYFGIPAASDMSKPIIIIIKHAITARVEQGRFKMGGFERSFYPPPSLMIKNL